MSQIVDFYTGGTDSKGRSLQDMLSWNDAMFEAVHDFIQWVFPLYEKSLHSINTPILSQEDIALLKASKAAQYNMLLSLERFEKFLGISKNEDAKRVNQWARNGDHNLLRITRVIRSLRLFGLEKEADNFYIKVMKIANSKLLSPVTKDFWNKVKIEDINASMTEKFLNLKRIDL